MYSLIKTNKFSILLMLLFLFGTASHVYHVSAQEDKPKGPVYIVQEGDSLWEIAVKFSVSLEELTQFNNITNPNQLSAGDKIVIPGLPNIEGILTTTDVQFGETLTSLSRSYQIPEESLIQLNHITSPIELFSGYSLVVPQTETTNNVERRLTVSADESMLEKAIIMQTTPWQLVIDNNLSGTWSSIPGDVLLKFTPINDNENVNQEQSARFSGLPEFIEAVNLRPLPMVQGKVAVIDVQSNDEITITGKLIDHDLNFFKYKKNHYISLQGVHAMLDPGLYTMELTVALPDNDLYNNSFSYAQSVYVKSGGYPFDPVLNVSPETIDPAVTKPEDAEWHALAAPVTPTKYWDGIFQSPAPPPFNDCFPSKFGNRRSYNGSAYEYFHTGLDFCGGVGIEILAPAAGKVVFAGPLTVRGNTTLIDHGWGIYTGYFHQSEILVNVGDIVKPGQVIGLVGGTGRVTGPHLHWEVWAGGVQVDPMDWLEEEFP